VEEKNWINIADISHNFISIRLKTKPIEKNWDSIKI